MHKLMPMLILCAGAANAHAQCENSFTFTLPDASSVKYVQSGPISTSSTYEPAALTSLSFTPDRRPGIWYSHYGPARTCTNPKGLVPQWLEAHWDNPSPSPLYRLGMKQRFDSFLAEGFRRITINRPGGNVHAQRVPQAHYHHLDDDQKDLLENDLSAWIDDTLTNVDANFELAVFIGSWQSGHPAAPGLGNFTNTSDFWDSDDDDDDLGFTYRSSSASIPAQLDAEESFMNPRSLSSMQETYQNYTPWLDIGCTAIWLDNSADSADTDDSGYLGRDRTIDLIQSPDYTGVNFVGEGIPHDDTTNIPLSDYLEAMPWMATDTFAHNQGWRDAASTVSVDPSTTEAIIVFETDNGATTLAQMASMRDRGFVIWVSAGSTNETLSPASVRRIQWLQRLYPEFTANYSGSIADFNGDGTVDCDDYDLFFTNWSNSYYNGSDFFGIWDGDIDGDGDVDFDDISMFGNLPDANYSGC